LLSIKNKKFGIIVSVIFGCIAVITSINNNSLFFRSLIFVTLPFILSLLIYDKFWMKEKKFLITEKNLLLINYFSVIVLISSVIGIILSSSLLVFSVPPSSLYIHNYVYPLYVLISNISPLLIILLMFSFFVKLLLRKLKVEKLW